MRKTLSRPPPFLAPFLPSSLYFPFLPCSLPAAADAAALLSPPPTREMEEEEEKAASAVRPFFGPSLLCCPAGLPPSPLCLLVVRRLSPSSVAGAKIGCWVLEDRKREGGGQQTERRRSLSCQRREGRRERE